ncbi:hypothetical protein HY989_00970 [Candidatus Micrarchaeota archaeon]|nr:hypothetical protein [Candidatus Micrarchaeota archaeon]
MAKSKIRVSFGIKRKLASQKLYKNEPYDNLLNRLLENAKWADDEGEFTKQTRKDIENGLLKIKDGKTISLAAILAKNKIGS